MNVAFKEWFAVDEALGNGRQSLLLRKGGIHERHGRFEVEHDGFLLYPTYLHQNPQSLKPEFRPYCADDRNDPSIVTLRHYARIVEVMVTPSDLAVAKRWDSFHVYSEDLIRMRYAYKPEQPLYLLLVRVHRLAAPTTIRETSAYAGCRSWVRLAENVAIGGASPVLDDRHFASLTDQLRTALTAQ